eukprot:3605522-Ditylum_brightwellii.AAC.2
MMITFLASLTNLRIWEKVVAEKLAMAYLDHEIGQPMAKYLCPEQRGMGSYEFNNSFLAC